MDDCSAVPVILSGLTSCAQNFCDPCFKSQYHLVPGRTEDKSWPQRSRGMEISNGKKKILERTGTYNMVRVALQ